MTTSEHVAEDFEWMVDHYNYQRTATSEVIARIEAIRTALAHSNRRAMHVSMLSEEDLDAISKAEVPNSVNEGDLLHEALTHARRGYADVSVNETLPCIICKQEAHGDAIFDAACAYLNTRANGKVEGERKFDNTSYKAAREWLEFPLGKHDIGYWLDVHIEPIKAALDKIMGDAANREARDGLEQPCSNTTSAMSGTTSPTTSQTYNPEREQHQAVPTNSDEITPNGNTQSDVSGLFRALNLIAETGESKSKRIAMMCISAYRDGGG